MQYRRQHGFSEPSSGYLGGETPDPAVQEAVEEEMLEFHRKEFGERYTALRLDKGYSLEEASKALVSTIDVNLDRKVKEAQLDLLTLKALGKYVSNRGKRDDNWRLAPEDKEPLKAKIRKLFEREYSRDRLVRSVAQEYLRSEATLKSKRD